MNNKNMVPKIRFNAYTVNWRHCKFSDLIHTMHGGASIAPADYRESGIPTVPKGAINSTGTANLSGSKYVSKEFFEKKISSCVYPGSLVTSLRDLVPTAPNMGRVVKLKGQDDKYLMPQGVYRLDLNNDVNERFLISFSNSNKYRKIISKEKNGSTQVHIRNSQYLGINLSVPSSEEQDKIGDFFKQLDKIVTLQHQLLNDHKQMKKAMLQKMFPQKGESVPRVRFAGFTDDWEQQELKDFVGDSISDGDWIEKEHIHESEKYRIIQTGNIGIGRYIDKTSSAKYINQYSFNQLKANEIFPGDILISRLADPAGRTTVLPHLSSRMVTAVDVAIIRPSNRFNVDFLVTRMNSIETLNEISKQVSGTSHKRLSRKNLEKIKINIPNLNEQEVIGNYFKKLDEIIALHEQKLETYQELKKVMLQKMFV